MDRILIIGSGGAGKSTMARALGEKLGLPVVHLDKLFWKPGWVETPKEEMDAKILAEMEKPQWIIDGNYNRTLSKRLEYCDTAIYLDYSRFTCLFGALKRVIRNLGRVRSDMGEGCPEKFDLEFLKWIWNFNKKHRNRYYKMLSEAPNARVIILKSRQQTRKFLDTL